MNILWKNLNDGYAVRIKGKYFYCNESAKATLDVLSQTSSIDEAMVLLSETSGISFEEAREWINSVNVKPSEITQQYKDVQGLEDPIKVQWKMTEKCNLKCKHCWNGDVREEQISEEQYLLMAEKICSWNVLEVTLTGGEIFTISNIDTIIEYFVSKGVYVNLFSNCILIDRHIEILKKYRDLVQVNVSIDGNREYHEKIRGNNTYERTLENVKLLLESKIKVVSNTVINKLNYTCIPDLIVKLVDIGIKDIQISHLILRGNAVENEKELLMDKSDYSIFRNMLQKCAFSNIKSNVHIYYSDINDATKQVYNMRDSQNTFVDNWSCCAGETRVTVTSNGNVVSCPFFDEYVMGNLIMDNVEDIWMSEKRLDFIRLKKKKSNGRQCIAYQLGRIEEDE